MATTYYLRDTNNDTTCDATGPKDLSKTQGSPGAEVTGSTGSSTFVEVMSYDIDVSGDTPATGTHSASIDVTTLSAKSEARFRVQEISAACAVLNSSTYTTFTTTGIKTLSASLTWGTGNRLRVSVELRLSSNGGTRTIGVQTQDADSFDTAPWTAPVTTAVKDVIGGGIIPFAR